MSDVPDIFMSFLSKLERSVGRFKATQVEIRRAVTEPPSHVPSERPSVRKARGSVSIWTSLSKPLSCALHHHVVGHGYHCSQVCVLNEVIKLFAQGS